MTSEQQLERIRLLRATGDHSVRSSVVIAITRFGLKTPIDLLFTYLDYRAVLRAARRAPGLLRASFLVEDLRTCYSFSIWASAADIPELSRAAPRHVGAARTVFGRARFRRGRGPEVWSTKWRLFSVSNNLNWDDFDLRDALVHLGGMEEPWETRLI